MYKIISILMLFSTTCLGQIKIGTFNIQVFGAKKSSNITVLDSICSVISRYDILAIQEVKDISGKTITILRHALNENGLGNHAIMSSPRSGLQESDVHYREQYLYIYDTTTINVVEVVDCEHSDKTLQWGLMSDTASEIKREPFIGLFKVKKTGLLLTLFNIHTSPSVANEDVTAMLKNISIICDQGRSPHFKNFIVLGDFNASCSYMSKTEIEKLKKEFPFLIWVIDNDSDSSVSSKDCAYDRILISAHLSNLVIDHGVDKRSVTKSVSDHYPVFMILEEN